jgi:hypothetical protein
MTDTGRFHPMAQIAFVIVFIFYLLTCATLGVLSLTWERFWIVTLATSASGIVGHFRYRTRRRADQRIAEGQAESGQPTVLYLRSFNTDATGLANIEPIPNMLTALLSYPMGPNADTEDPLASTLAPIGQLIKLGRSGERFPVLGAAPLYTPDDKWKDVVNTWLTRAQLVVLRVGTTGGLWWETARVLETVTAEKVLFYMLGTGRTLYDSATERLRVEFNIDLPAFAEVQRWGRVSGFFMFDADWNPRFLPIVAPFWRISWIRPMKSLFYYALRPVYVLHGLDWSPLPVSKLRF